MKDDFNTIDEIMIITMLNDYIAQCIQEQTPQCIIDEMIEAKEKLVNFIVKNS